MRIGLITPAPAVITTSPAIPATPARWDLKRPAVWRRSCRFGTRPEGFSRLPPMKPPPCITAAALLGTRGRRWSFASTVPRSKRFPDLVTSVDEPLRPLSSAAIQRGRALTYDNEESHDHQVAPCRSHLHRRDHGDRRLWWVEHQLDADTDLVDRGPDLADDSRAGHWLQRIGSSRRHAAERGRRAEHQRRLERCGSRRRLFSHHLHLLRHHRQRRRRWGGLRAALPGIRRPGRPGGRRVSLSSDGSGRRLGGEGGIRTHGGYKPHRFSRAAPSTTRTPLRERVYGEAQDPERRPGTEAAAPVPWPAPRLMCIFKNISSRIFRHEEN